MKQASCGDGKPRPETYEGYQAHTTARTTGTLVVLCLTEGQGLSVEDGGKYLLMCEAHNRILQHDNKRFSLELMRHPEEWCEVCMGSEEPDTDD